MRLLLAAIFSVLISCAGTQVKVNFDSKKETYLYIKNLKLDKNSKHLKSNGIYDEVNNGIILALINKKPNDYKIIDDTAIVSLIDQTTQKLLFQRDSENAMQKIGNSLGFNILLDGELSERNGKIVLSLKKMGKLQNRYEVQDQINLDFYRHQTAYYTEQVGKKIFQPSYQIKKNAPDFLKSDIVISEISIEKIKKAKSQSFIIPKMSFSANSKNDIELFVNGLQTYIDDANNLLEQEKYAASLKQFKNIVNILSEERKSFTRSQRKYLDKLSENLKKQLRQVTTIYHSKLRYETSLVYQKKIELIDKTLRTQKTLILSQSTSFAKQYKTLLNRYEKLPRYKQEYKIANALKERINHVGLQAIEQKEQQADQLYISLKFNRAYDKYQIIKKDIKTYLIRDFKKKNRQINQKIEICIQSAKSYISSQVEPLLELAKANHQRYVLEAKMKQRGTSGTNRRIYKKKALKLTQKAHSVLSQNNSLFLTGDTVDKYNQTAKLVNQKVGKDLNHSLGNFLLTPFRYMANIGKGVSDIFVFKFGLGLGAGAQATIFGSDLGYANLPLEVSTAYTPQKKESRISETISQEVFGSGLLGAGVCHSYLFIRVASESYARELSSENENTICKPISYFTNINVWVGLGPAVMINIETHRFVELFGILLGQDWNITGNQSEKTHRFPYFPYKKAKYFNHSTQYNSS